MSDVNMKNKDVRCVVDVTYAGFAVPVRYVIRLWCAIKPIYIRGQKPDFHDHLVPNEC